MILGLLLALLVGLSLGLLGGGGAILTVPIFVYVLGHPAKTAIAMSLPVVGVVSLVGAVSHWRAGHVDLRRALLFGVIAMAGAYAGARASVLVSGTLQLALLAIVMLVAAGSMLRGGAEPAPVGDGAEPTARSAWTIPLVAVGVGLLTGLVGIGGGFLIVPALVLLAGLPMKHAVGTSLVVIAMNSASGFAGYVGQVDVPWMFVAGFAAVAAAGILLGSHLIRFVPQRALKRGFAVFLLLMGGLILYQNRGAFTRGPAPASAAAR